jgi:hypothetical protein
VYRAAGQFGGADNGSDRFAVEVAGNDYAVFVGFHDSMQRPGDIVTMYLY